MLRSRKLLRILVEYQPILVGPKFRQRDSRKPLFAPWA
jgi:hypothetical protein